MILKIDPKLRDLIPPLDPQEFELLTKSILTEGCRDKLVIWKEQGILIDGHNRYKICTKYNIPFEVTQKSFPNIEAVKAWMEDNQLARRNLTDDQRKILIGRRYEREKAAQGGSNKGKDLTTAEEIAIDTGVSPSSVRRFAKDAKFYDLLKKENPDLAKQVWDGKISLQEVKLNPPKVTSQEVTLPFKIKFGDLIQVAQHYFLVGHPTDKEDIKTLLNETQPDILIQSQNIKNSKKVILLTLPKTVYLWDTQIQVPNYTLSSQIIWLKTTYDKTPDHYTPRYQTLYYYTTKLTSFKGPSQTNVWEIPNVSQEKPKEVFMRPIRNHPGIVYFPYPESNTALAVHELDRSGFFMDPDPKVIESLVKSILELDSSIVPSLV